MRGQVEKQLRGKKPTAIGLLGFALAFNLSALAAADTRTAWDNARAGLEHFYNLEYEPATANFEQALSQDPENPLFLNYLANTYLFHELHRTGRLDSGLYTESNQFLRTERPPVDPQVLEKVKELLAQSKDLCRRRLKENPRDKAALYALGIAYGTEANYELTVHRRGYAAVKAGSKAKDAHERLKRLDPDSYDANLVLGLYEYTVGSIPAALKWLALLVGHRGSKKRGIELLQSAMAQGRLTTTDAAILLTLIYNREKKYAEGRAVLEKLGENYPRNHLVPLEIAYTYLREGNEEAALKEYAQLVEKVERRAPGFERMPRGRLYYQIGAIHQRRENYEEALGAFARVTGAAESDDLLSAYASVRKGEVYLALNQLEQVREECARVLALAYPGPRGEAQRLLDKLEKRQP